MNLWSKGVERSRTGERRQEENILDIFAKVQNFFDDYTGEINMYSMRLVDNKIYIKFDDTGENIPVKIKWKSDYSIMKSIKDGIKDWYWYKSKYTPPEIYYQICENLMKYEKTRNVNDLYQV